MSRSEEVHTTNRPALFVALVLAVALLGLVTLGDRALLPSGVGIDEPGSSMHVSLPAAVPETAERGAAGGAGVVWSGRVPIPVLIEQRRGDEACSDMGHVPIAVGIICHRMEHATSSP